MQPVGDLVLPCNTFRKLVSNTINECLCKWVEKFHKIDESQSGFRSNYSRMDNMFMIQSLAQKY